MDSGVSGIFFHQGKIQILGGQKNFCPLKKYSVLGHNRQEVRAEYLLITKKKLVLSSVPMPHMRVFFIKEKHTFELNQMPTYWSYAPYAPGLDKPLDRYI